MAENDAPQEQNEGVTSSTAGDLDLSGFSAEDQEVLLDMLAHYRGEQLPPDRLQRVMKFAQKQLREKENEERRQLEVSLAPQLKPYEDKIAAVEEQVRIVGEDYDAKIEALRTEKRSSVEKIRQQIAEILKEYNPFREKLGLKARTMFSGSRKRGEKKHKYDYEFKDEETMTLVIDGKHREQLDVGNKVRVRTITDIFDKYGIKDETGGRARGVVTQVKLRRARIRAAAKHEETLKDLNK
jgi:hypothetical protein